MTVKYLQEYQRRLAANAELIPDTPVDIAAAIEIGEHLLALDRVQAALRLAQTFHIPAGTYKEGVE